MKTNTISKLMVYSCPPPQSVLTVPTGHSAHRFRCRFRKSAIGNEEHSSIGMATVPSQVS